MSVTIKPLEDRVLVAPLEAEQTTKSGLVIPDTAKEKPQEGEILAVGPGRIDDNGNRVPLDVAVGDKVIYARSTARFHLARAWARAPADPPGRSTPCPLFLTDTALVPTTGAGAESVMGSGTGSELLRKSEITERDWFFPCRRSSSSTRTRGARWSVASTSSRTR